MQLLLLHVEVVFHEAALVAPGPEAQVLDFGPDHGCFGGDDEPRVVAEYDGEAVPRHLLFAVDHPFALVADESGDLPRKAEQRDHLIDQMCAQIIDRARGWQLFCFPGRLGLLGSVPIEVGLEFGEAS